MTALTPFHTLPLQQQVAQMFVVRASGHLFDSQIRYPAWEPQRQTLQRWIGELGLGGVLLIDGSAAELRLKTQQLQEWADIPLLLCADIEEGVGQRFSGATWFPPPMALSEIARRDWDKAIEYAELMGAMTAREAVATGLNWILAPVVDVNNNSDNPVINVRSFGETPEVVSALATAFLRGTQRFSVLATAKHFPGHGDTSVDSHYHLPTIPHDIDRLSAVELPPFKAVVAAGVDAVMTAHLRVPVWDADEPATMSQRILTEQLRRKLGFEGLVVTDALVMGAIAKRYDANEAPILAIEAGADIVLMPSDPEGGIQAVCEAIESGRISRDRLCQSLDRIWQAKMKVCSQPLSPTSPQQDLDRIATPDTLDLTRSILRESGRRQGQRLSTVSSGYNVVIVDDWLRCSFLGHQTPAIALPKQQGFAPYLVDLGGNCQPPEMGTGRPTIVQVFVRGNPFGSSRAIAELADTWLNKLLKTGDLVGFSIYGSPYTQEQISQKLPLSLPVGFSFGQMPEAQAIALEALFGKTPLQWSALKPLA
ncbi:glycoside hydrolase family 3 N-terminal domain-containing protein [Baaleninema simplex]|uniref:glycoside hydrolase family 3 N-terminal domain-containing protein n=1 Tax=Baaleninema simplex TaxID=2862350 RepID=UPI000347813B|nr:glycoside hydrolase family 3 N-terminal domain-containing protein [Baaleninema simplex]